MLNSVDAVIKALGGPTKIAALAGTWSSAVSNWRSRVEIPTEHFVLISDALAASGQQADRSVFGFNEART